MTHGGDNARLDGQVALITGGASGIGRALALALHGAGMRVVVADVQTPIDLPPAIHHRRIDVTHPDHIDTLYAWIRSNFDTPAVLAPCAGAHLHERLAEGDPAKWAALFDLNVVGVLRVLRAFLPDMLARAEGDIVLMSSVAARHAYPYGAVYGASKAALDMIGETLRLEVQPQLRVLSVAPGVVDTPFFDAGHGPTPATIGWGALAAEDVADAVLYALTRPREVALNRLVLRPAAQPL
ncbi:SDR family NAD(P)-dependent oxidoreductase [Ectothiorhodospiraceae bacterium 2226]|nr:SDR family NAD(P)-dependent oxidoreductase [Ectothiorhodospiraceae bacterium 2226]